MKIGILGGGLTGLSLGLFLKHDFEILEKEKECGGLCRSIQENGFTFDYGGGHILFSRDEEILNFMLKLLSDNIVKCKRNSKIFYNGIYIKYPFENGLSDLPLQENYECLNDFIDVLIKSSKGELKEPYNFQEWIYNTFGKGIAEKYLIPYNKKIWNFDPQNMGIDWIKIKDRLPKPNPEDIIKSALGVKTEGYKAQLYFYYPKNGGIQSLIREMESRIKNITRKFNIKRIFKRKDKWVVSNGFIEKRFDKLVSTIPLHDIILMLEKVPEKVKKAVNDLKFNSLMTVLIGIDQDNLFDKHWIYIPDMKMKPHRIICPTANTKETAPQGKSSLMAEITCKFGDSYWNKFDSEIINEVINDLHERKIIDKNKVIYKKLMRSKYAYVIYDLDYQKNIRIVKDFFNEIGIELCGRFAEFKYLNMDACIRSALEMAKKLNSK